jgi:predicted Fe-Mo cluster-binding NifX family protein
MSFGDRLKELASKAGGKAQDLGEKGYHASRDLLNKAGAKAQNLGEKGVLMLEIKQLEGQAQKLTGRLGAEAYNAFVERGVKTLSADTAAVKEILAELGSLREAIEKREAELEGKRG